jgi:hypothetical protein
MEIPTIIPTLLPVPPCLPLLLVVLDCSKLFIIKASSGLGSRYSTIELLPLHLRIIPCRIDAMKMSVPCTKSPNLFPVPAILRYATCKASPRWAQSAAE